MGGEKDLSGMLEIRKKSVIKAEAQSDEDYVNGRKEVNVNLEMRRVTDWKRRL